MNMTFSIGNMTDEPAVYEVSGGHKKATFTLALNRMKDGADFPRFIAWDKKAELIENYCHKGTKLAIAGHINTGSYEKQGEKIYTTAIVVDNIEFCDKKPKDGAQSDDFMKIPDGMTEEMPFA